MKKLLLLFVQIIDLEPRNFQINTLVLRKNDIFQTDITLHLDNTQVDHQ